MISKRLGVAEDIKLEGQHNQKAGAVLGNSRLSAPQLEKIAFQL